MATRRELCSEEDATWRAFLATWDRVPDDLFEKEGYNPGWSAKDMVAHIGSWQAYAVQMFERIRVGTYESERLDVDAMNAQFVEAWRDQPVWAAKAECFASRTRFVQEFGLLSEVTREAEEWFLESGTVHYREHMPRLEEWVAELAGRSANPADS
jgi:hypothetical protein